MFVIVPNIEIQRSNSWKYRTVAQWYLDAIETGVATVEQHHIHVFTLYPSTNGKSGKTSNVEYGGNSVWMELMHKHTHIYTQASTWNFPYSIYKHTHSQSSIGRSMRRRRNKKFIMAACLFWQTWNHMNYTKFSLAFYSKNKTKSISRLFFLYYLSRRCILWIRRMLKVKMVSMKNPKAVFEWNAIVVYDLLWYFWKSFSFGWKIMNVEKRKNFKIATNM